MFRRKSVDVPEIKFHRIGYIAEIGVSTTEHRKHEKEKSQQAGRVVFGLEHGDRKVILLFLGAAGRPETRLYVLNPKDRI